MQGKIIKGISGFYYIHVAGSGIYECKAKGVFRNQNIKPLVGDNVEIAVLDEEHKKGNIEKVLPRENELIRPAVANIDLALIIFAAAKPQPNFNLLDRFLVMMEYQNVPVAICFNKTDLVTEEELHLNMVSLAEPFILRKAIRHFEEGRIVIFACGTGNPYCSTDTAAALRACEISADILLMAKNVDGIYDSDPKTNPFAKKYENLRYSDIINRGLKVIDFTAATMCMENNVPTLAFGLNEDKSIVRAVCGEELGTVITV